MIFDNAYGPDNPHTMITSLDLAGLLLAVAIVLIVIMLLRGSGGEQRKVARHYDPSLYAGTGASITEGEREELTPAVALPARVEVEVTEQPDTGGHVQAVKTGHVRMHSEPITGRDVAESLGKLGRNTESEKIHEHAR